jgi:mannose-6-phosphate isomerase-like protein (cupin superfamily)
MAALEFIDLSGEIQEDRRGLSFFPWRGRPRQAQDLLTTFHLVSIRPGQTRGNHLHPGFEEWLYLFHGTDTLIWEAPLGAVQEKEISGNRTLVRIPPGVAHALRNPGPELLYLLAWRERAGPGPGEPETVPRFVSSEG